MTTTNTSLPTEFPNIQCDKRNAELTQSPAAKALRPKWGFDRIRRPKSSQRKPDATSKNATTERMEHVVIGLEGVRTYPIERPANPRAFRKIAKKIQERIDQENRLVRALAHQGLLPCGCRPEQHQGEDIFYLWQVDTHSVQPLMCCWKRGPNRLPTYSEIPWQAVQAAASAAPNGFHDQSESSRWN